MLFLRFGFLFEKLILFVSGVRCSSLVLSLGLIVMNFALRDVILWERDSPAPVEGSSTLRFSKKEVSEKLIDLRDLVVIGCFIMLLFANMEPCVEGIFLVKHPSWPTSSRDSVKSFSIKKKYIIVNHCLFSTFSGKHHWRYA